MNVDRRKLLLGQIGKIGWAFDGDTLWLALVREESTASRERRRRAMKLPTPGRVRWRRRGAAA